MLDHSNQSESLNRLQCNPLINGFPDLDISGSLGLSNQHRHPSSRFVLSGIVLKSVFVNGY